MPSFGGGGADLDWEDGIPHREGAWTFTTTGTTDRAPLPGLDEAERTRHKGELVYPNLMAVARPPTTSRRSCCWPLDADRTRIAVHLLFAPTRSSAADDFDPHDAGDLWDLVNQQDWAICESVQRGMSSRAYRQGWFAPMEDASLDIRRWLLPRLERVSEPGTERARRLRRRRARRAGQRDGVQLARRGRPRASGSSSSSSATSAAPSHDTSPDPAAQLPHAGVRAADAARRTTTGPRLEHDERRDARHAASAGSTCSRRTRRSRRSTTRRRWPRCGVDYELLDAAAVAARWPQFAAARRHRRRSTRSDGAIVPAARGTAAMQGQARRHGADLRDRSPVTARRRPDDGGVEVVDRRRDVRLPAGLVVVRRRLDQRGARRTSTSQLPLDRDAGAGDLLRAGRPDAVRAGRLPLWIWMDDPSFYGFPSYGEADGQGGAGLRRSEVDPRRPAVRARPGDGCNGWPTSWRRRCPAAAAPVRSMTCLYTLTPDRDFVLGPVPGHESVLVGLGAGHGFKFAPTFGRLLADLVVDGRAPATDLTPFRLGPAGPDRARPPAHWLV